MQDYKRIKYYIISAGLLYVIFVWLNFTGRRLAGDDVSEKELRQGMSSHNRFYHK